MATQQFGNSDTQRKLVLIEEYLTKYVTVLKNQTFRLIYVDVFAGTGAIFHKPEIDDQGFIVDEAEILEAFSWGSAIRALDVVPPFDSYFFADKSAKKIDELRDTVAEFHPKLVSRCEFKNGDANEVLREFVSRLDPKRDRVLVFLDPFGAQVEWATIELLGRTEVVDLWYLFPAMAVQRMLPRHGAIADAWSRRLTLLFGNDEWITLFYQKPSTGDLFGEQFQTVDRKADINLIQRYVNHRLAQEFKGGVAKRAFPLLSRNGMTMFLLFFAISNPSPKAKGLALRLANGILDKAV